MKKVFVMVVIILILVSAGYSYFILGNQMRSMRGESLGKKYVSKVYTDFLIVGKNCQGEDVDGNSYITCNFRLKQSGSGTEKVITLQCPTFIKSFLATSCKEQGYNISQ